MLPIISQYLSKIATEDEAQFINNMLLNLTNVFPDSSVELGISNIVATLDDYDSVTNKNRIYSLISIKQVQSLNGSGIFLNDNDEYNFKAIDYIIQLLVDVENYEYKSTLVDICQQTEDNIDIIIQLINEVYGVDISDACYHDVQAVDIEFVNKMIDYLDDPYNDILDSPCLLTPRLGAFKSIISNYKNSVAQNYLENGYSPNVDLSDILSIVNEDLINCETDIIEELKLLILLSSTPNEEITEVIHSWAETNIDDDKLYSKVSSVEFGGADD